MCAYTQFPKTPQNIDTQTVKVDRIPVFLNCKRNTSNITITVRKIKKAMQAFILVVGNTGQVTAVTRLKTQENSSLLLYTVVLICRKSEYKCYEVYIKGEENMQAKAILQSIGTVSSLILAFITLQITHNLLEINALDLTDVFSKYGEFLLMVLTIGLMIITGYSYFNSRVEHVGITRLLYLFLAVAHVFLAPSALIIGIMKIQFGQYWWAVLIGIFILIYWGNQQRESQN
jgi:hypothetical protein